MTSDLAEGNPRCEVKQNLSITVSGYVKKLFHTSIGADMVYFLHKHLHFYID